jgi:hypothetical protein
MSNFVAMAEYETHMQTPLPKSGDHSKAWYVKAAKLAAKACFPGSAKMHYLNSGGTEYTWPTWQARHCQKT